MRKARSLGGSLPRPVVTVEYLNNVDVTMPDRLPLSFDRALAVADVLAAGPRGFGELRAGLGGLAAPTLSRLLRALVAAGLVTKREDGYRVGPRLERTARRLVGGLDPAALVEPVLAELAQATGDSAAFYGWHDAGLTLRATCEVPESFHYMPVGQAVPELTQHGFAQAVVAQLPEHERRSCWRRSPVRSRPLAEFIARTAVIRRDGYVVERGEHRPGVTRVAAAVRQGRDGAVAGSIGVSSLSRDAEHVRALAAEVARAAATASSLLATTGNKP
jgi:DNA-binding IclR family transcriptional regulator